MDPTQKQLAELAVQLGEVTVRNTAGAILDKVRAAKVRKNDKETISQLEEIISSLISDKNDLVQIAQTYEQEFAAQRISKEDINYITEKFVPTLRELLKKLPNSDSSTANMEQTFDVLKPIMSVETLTILQLLGFNFKRGIGEPLTVLLQKFILSKAPSEQSSDLELSKLIAAQNTEFLKLAQDKESSKRYQVLNGSAVKK